MMTEALHNQVVEAVAVRVAVELAAVAQNEAALAVVAIHAEHCFPHFRRAVGADRSVEVHEVVALLATPESVRREPEYPQLPAILARRGSARLFGGGGI